MDACQFAYRKHASAQSCVVRMLDDIRLAIDLKMVTISVFFDFSKTFDMVQHNAFLRTLIEAGLSRNSVHWMLSYLENHTKAVRDRYDDRMSALRRVRTGVPQGSVLGSLLFTLYVSGVDGVLRHCKYNFYADDLQIYLHCELRELHNGIAKVNKDIAHIVQWASNMGLVLNSAKTQDIIFGTARNINAIEIDGLPEIKIEDNVV